MKPRIFQFVYDLSLSLVNKDPLMNDDDDLKMYVHENKKSVVIKYDY